MLRGHHLIDHMMTCMALLEYTPVHTFTSCIMHDEMGLCAMHARTNFEIQRSYRLQLKILISLGHLLLSV